MISCTEQRQMQVYKRGIKNMELYDAYVCVSKCTRARVCVHICVLVCQYVS